MKDCVVIPAYNGYKDKLPYGIKSWEYYCSKHNLDLHILDKDQKLTRNQAIWQRWFDLDSIFKTNRRVLMVDLDTMVRWDTPNLFQQFPDGFNCVNHLMDSSFRIGEYHFSQWGEFTNFKYNNSFYFNCGVLLFDQSHYKIISQHLSPYYEYYMEQMDKGNTPKPGKNPLNAYDQTAINLVTQEFLFPEMKFRDTQYNLLAMHYYDNFDFVNQGYIWHFTGEKLGGGAKRALLMEHIWNTVKEYYK